MRLIGATSCVALLALRLAAVARGADASESQSGSGSGYTLDSVKADIDDYLDKTHATQAKAKSTRPSGCALACGFLSYTLHDQLFYPDSEDYQFQESRYWSQQQASTEPTCRFAPESSLHVSLAVLTSRVSQCHFAVKSGGHAAFAGASNVQDGLTIDLLKLNAINVSDDLQETEVGAGNVWYDVYQKLTPRNLTVIGGRVSAIGVGGLTLGGGISFFSNRHGWACDNVNTYEVVFADGSIHMVSYKDAKYADLYWALRGGGNNFGIVTRFFLATYPQGDMWGGSQVFPYLEGTSKAINNAFYNLGEQTPSDPYAQIITSYAYAQQLNAYVISSALQYGKPEPYPETFKNFTSVLGAISNTLRVVDLPSLTVEFNDTNPGGFRQSYWTFAVANDADLMGDMVDIFMDETDSIKDASGLTSSKVFQLITRDMQKQFTKNGGNALGLENQGPLNLINIAISWSDAADDDRILQAAGNMVKRSLATAKKRGLDNKFLYQNYASKSQKVFPSYGKENYAKLKKISKKYDPSGVWQRLEDGYFNL